LIGAIFMATSPLRH